MFWGDQMPDLGPTQVANLRLTTRSPWLMLTTCSPWYRERGLSIIGAAGHLNLRV
jgi:hypothetical protein